MFFVYIIARGGGGGGRGLRGDTSGFNDLMYTIKKKKKNHSED